MTTVRGKPPIPKRIEGKRGKGEANPEVVLLEETQAEEDHGREVVVQEDNHVVDPNHLSRRKSLKKLEESRRVGYPTDRLADNG